MKCHRVTLDDVLLMLLDFALAIWFVWYALGWRP